MAIPHLLGVAATLEEIADYLVVVIITQQAIIQVHPFGALRIARPLE
jgi:hypothetical protein